MVGGIDLHHWCTGAPTKTLYFTESNKAVGGSFPQVYAQMTGTSRHKGIATPQPTRGGGAHLHMVLAHRLEIVHRVKTGHFVDFNVGHTQQGPHLFQSGGGQPAIIAGLGQVQQGHNSAAGLVNGVLFEDSRDGLMVFRGERGEEI